MGFATFITKMNVLGKNLKNKFTINMKKLVMYGSKNFSLYSQKPRNIVG